MIDQQESVVINETIKRIKEAKPGEAVDVDPNVFNGVLKQLEDNAALSSKPLGLKYDSEKPRMDLLDPGFLEDVANVLTFGARKYAAHNWRGGIVYSRLIAAMYRHLGAINKGEDIDPESGLTHIGHLGCCAQFLSWMMKNRTDLDDRYKYDSSPRN